MSAAPDDPRDAIQHLLRNRCVFDIDSYGWLNEEDVDPEFVGFVMWTQSPPYDHDIFAWQNNTPPGRAPTVSEQRLMELGHDFFGLMKTARHFIGHALYHQSAVQPIRVEPTDFDFNDFAALVALTTAADRLSDFIIVTILGKKNDEKGQRDKACDKLRASDIGIEADELQRGFKSIGRARKDRNEAIHQLATQPARAQRLLISRDREAFEQQQWPNASNREAPYEVFIQEQKQLDQQELADVEAQAQLLCDCYIELIGLGELTFRIEQKWRHRQDGLPG